MSFFADTKTPTRWKKLTADHQHVDTRLVGTRRLKMLTPKIPPCYLTINQSENCAQAEHTPCDPLPHTVFKNPSLKANKHCTFLCHKPVSVDWLYCALGEWTQVCFMSIMHGLTELKELKYWVFCLFVFTITVLNSFISI